jgi:protein-disulfide isomerase
MLDAKQAFIAGIVGGLLVLCTIGFFILLGAFVGKDSGAEVYVPPTNNEPTGQAPSGEINLAAVDSDDHIRGKNSAKVSIVEFSDYECPFCNRFHETMKEVLTAYPDDVKWVYRHFPLDSLHPSARAIANAAECAAEQDKFWEFSDDVFSTYGNGGRITKADFANVAKKVGVKNISKFSSCVDSDKYAAEVTADQNDGAGAGAQGTPYSVIIGPNGEKAVISGAQPFAAVQSAVEQMLAN